MSPSQFSDFDKDDFTHEEFQLLVDVISILTTWDRKYNAHKYDLNTHNRTIIEPTSNSILIKNCVKYADE